MGSASVERASDHAGERRLATTFAAGDIVGARYRVVRFIARGGMGEVYEVEDLELRIAIALKTIRPDRAGNSREIARIKREILLARKVTHPNICRVFDVGYHVDTGGDEIAFLTMELVAGESLDKLVARRGPLPMDDARLLLRQMAMALGAAHAAGVIHRDFKSQNVLVADEDPPRAVITDFGLARSIDGDVTQTLEFAGTPAYMAPEQITGHAIGPSADVYALGVTAFEMVTGRLPFEDQNPFGLTARKCRESAPAARTVRPDLDPCWNAAIARALERDPANRFGDPVAFVAALGDVVASPAEAIVALRGAPPRRRAWRAIVVGAIAAVGIAIAVVATRPAGRAAHEARREASVAPGVAVETAAEGALRRLIRLHGPGFEMIEQVVRDPDGSLYVAGRASAGAVLGDAPLPAIAPDTTPGIVAKIDPTGHLAWTHVFQTKQGSVTTLTLDGGGQLLVGGAYRGGGLDPGDGVVRHVATADGFVAALSAADGALRWSHVLGAEREGVVRVGAIGPDGNFYVGGEYAGMARFGGDASYNSSPWPSPFVASYTRDGTLRWVLAGHGGQNVRTRSIGFYDGALLIGGEATGDLDVDGHRWAQRDFRGPFLVAIDPATGRTRWARSYPATGGAVWSIASAPDGRLVAGGYYLRWIELIPGRRFVAPEIVQRAWVAELDPATGEPRAAVDVSADQAIDTTMTVRGVGFLPDGRIVIAGGFGATLRLAGRTLVASGNTDRYVATLDGALRPVTATAIQGDADERLKGIAILPGGVIALRGRHEGSLTLGDRRLALDGATDGFYAELDAAKLLQ